MTKVLILALAFLFTSGSYACTAPRSGAKYDALIRIEKLGDSKYKLVAPYAVDNLVYGADFHVSYSRQLPEGFRVAEFSRAIDVERSGDNYEAVFEVKHVDEMIPYVRVFWHPRECCLCGAVGLSENLLR